MLIIAVLLAVVLRIGIRLYKNVFSDETVVLYWAVFLGCALLPLFSVGVSYALIGQAGTVAAFFAHGGMKAAANSRRQVEKQAGKRPVI